MLTVAATVSAVIAFSATSALYGADLASERRTGNVGQLGFWTSAALTAVVAVAIGASEGLSALVRGGGLFATLALLTAGGFLAVRRAFKVRVAAALVAPVCGLMLLLSLVLPYQSATVEDAYQTLLLTHVGLALLGLGTFALSAVLATLYLVQERQLRQRQFGRLFQRLPSLEELDTASFRLVVLGFVIYTVALLVGFLWFFQVDAGGSSVRIVFAMVAWVAFAAVIHTRITSGWRGRQAAWMTVGGALSSFAVLAGYTLA